MCTEHFTRLTKKEWERSTNICLITQQKKQYLPLLLLADEQERMIDRYLERGDLYVLFDAKEQPLAVAVITDEGNGICELKNLAVTPTCQRKGYGSRMVDYLCGRYQDKYHTMLVGTGDSRQTVGFYESCGFVYSHTVTDFFTQHYDHPIIEDGKVLRDMLYFKKELSSAYTL